MQYFLCFLCELLFKNILTEGNEENEGFYL